MPLPDSARTRAVRRRPGGSLARASRVTSMWSAAMPPPDSRPCTRPIRRQLPGAVTRHCAVLGGDGTHLRRVRHPACRLRPTSRAPAGAASRPAWRPRHAQLSSSSSCAAARPAVPPRAPAPGAAALPCGNGPRPGSSAHRVFPPSGRGLRCGQRPPDDHHVSAQTGMIRRWPPRGQHGTPKI